MSENKFKPFAVASGANVLSDDQLANSPELSTGFQPKTVADSRLVGKLIKQSSAMSYGIGEFIADNVTDDTVDDADPIRLASQFQDALNNNVTAALGGGNS